MKIMKLKLIVFDNNIIIILCFCLKILRFYYSIILCIFALPAQSDKIPEIKSLKQLFQ